MEKRENTLSKKRKNHKKSKQNKKQKQNNHYKEEYAAEISAQPLPTERKRDEDVQENNRINAGTVIGYIALFLALFSIAVYPITFGLFSIVLGLVAVYYGAKTIGYTAVGFGAFSVLFTLFYPLAIAPF